MEAMAWLATARVLVNFVPMARWRKWLCPRAAPAGTGIGIGPAEAHLLAHAVERAARRLPGEYLCLPQALALLWMLRRRRSNGNLVIGMDATATEPGGLHAWVEYDGDMLIGGDVSGFHPILSGKP